MRKGYLGWMHDQGISRVTVHHIANVSRRRVSDVRFILSCEGIAEEPRLCTVAIQDLLKRWPDA